MTLLVNTRCQRTLGLSGLSFRPPTFLTIAQSSACSTCHSNAPIRPSGSTSHRGKRGLLERIVHIDIAHIESKLQTLRHECQPMTMHTNSFDNERKMISVRSSAQCTTLVYLNAVTLRVFCLRNPRKFKDLRYGGNPTSHTPARNSTAAAVTFQT